MPKSDRVKTTDIYTIPGPEIRKRYFDNKMSVHFQGMSKTLQFPQTIALMGAPTCSVGISPEGLYNRLNDAGRVILLNHNGVQFGSAPFVRVAGKNFMLTTRDPQAVEGPDDVPALKNYYHPAVSEKQTSLSLATPLAELAYKLGKIKVVRRFVSPLLSGNAHALMPISVEEFEVTNTSNEEQQVILVIPRPSLVNLQEKELKPTDQDTVYVCSTPVKAQVHKAFASSGMKGVVMASQDCADRMVVAVPEMDEVSVDAHPSFCLNRLRQDLLLNDDGTFYEKRAIIPKQDYGAAISLTFTLKPKATRKLPFTVALDFPQQSYIDGTTFERKYVKNFKDKETRALDLAKIALDSYPAWLERTQAIQNSIFDHIRKSPSYKTDRAGALRLTRLILNEFSFPLSNACIWIEKDGKDVARFLECFDYAYIDPSDVDWYSMVLLMLFPDVEQELCQRFIDSILAEDLSKRFYHLHGSFVEARKHFKEHPEEYEGRSLTQIWDTFKIKGSIAHDVGAMPKGHPLRNVSDYAWYNSNYWVDLFPKLATRVLRDVKFLGDVDFLKRNWATLKFGFDFLETYDIDGDGIPEGNPHEVKNTFDNLVLFGADAYDTTNYMACCESMKIMAQIMNDEPARKRYEADFATAAAVFEKLWREKKNRKGVQLQYYVTCYDTKTKKMNTDVWTNQLDALWAMIAMGEEPFIPDERAKQVLKTIYKVNRTTMGWAMTRTENSEEVESEQGQDVYTTSNYVFAQLLDYYGLVKESKEVYKAMDRVIFEHGNSLISPDNLRAELEKEMGEVTKGPHYIVAAYPRPGAVLTQLVIQFIKQSQERTGAKKVGSERLQSLARELFVNPR
ncbi:MAG TPA: GH116 family glycosyl hydrolase [Candidatus Acidoferrales bacterium]|nr:GH116 family glycosyl hydrolase [Candidatus Acidoferrales bacterium]